MAGPALAIGPDKFDITPAEHAACDADAERLCIAAYPDEDALVACMKVNMEQLTPLCLKTFKTGMQRRHLPL